MTSVNLHAIVVVFFIIIGCQIVPPVISIIISVFIIIYYDHMCLYPHRPFIQSYLSYVIITDRQMIAPVIFILFIFIIIYQIIFVLCYHH